MPDTAVDTVETIEGSVELEPAADRNLFRTTDPVEVLAQAKRVAQALKDEIAAAGMVQRIGGREFVRVEGIQTGLAMLGCSTRIVWSRQIEDGWEARAEIVASDERVIGAGEAMCTRSERNWAHRDAYALRSMAQTRAIGKAGRTVLSFVLTLSGHPGVAAEEMDADMANEPRETPVPAWAKPTSDIPAASRALTQLLAAAGIPDPAKATAKIGQRLFDQCDNAIPVVVHGLIEEIRDVIFAVLPRSEEAER
jgi:hypothetical protein